MLVCAHGDVTEFCENRNMFICDKHDGEIKDYKGVCRVLVTDKDMTPAEYYFLKGEMLGRGIELISTMHNDSALMAELISSQAMRKKKNYSGRQPFGFQLKDGAVMPTTEGMAVVQRIFEMRDAGYTLRQIQAEKDVHHPDGRKISISTIQQIIKNRNKYENE